MLGAWLPALRAERAAALARVETLFPILRERRHQLAHSHSGGEQQQVAIARALMGNPRFIMLDEPFLGLSPRMVEEIRTVIRRINEQGVTVLFNEQSLRLSLNMSHRGYILESGRLALSGTSRGAAGRPEPAPDLYGVGSGGGVSALDICTVMPYIYVRAHP